MEALGATAAAIQILANLGKTILFLQSAIRDVRHIDETTAYFEQELDAFQFTLVVFSAELRGHAWGAQTPAWCRPDVIERLFANAMSTFSRLEYIFTDISKQRTSVQKLREYYRAKQYEDEVRVLRQHVSTYMSTLTLPILLLARYVQEPDSCLSVIPMNRTARSVTNDADLASVVRRQTRQETEPVYL